MRNFSSFSRFSDLSISPEDVLSHAYKTGFCSRIGKIHPCDFWESFCVESMRGVLSHNDLAARMDAEGKASVSRQAIGYKTSEAGLQFFKSILAMAMRQNVHVPEEMKRNHAFKRIIVQDSTVLKLPQRLYPDFSGVKNAHATVSNARVQAVYDVLAGSFLHYSIDPYSRNDQAAALDFNLQPGDLSLKDRGYLSIASIRKVQNQKAHTIFRYKNPTVFYDVKTGEKIDLAHALEKEGCLDKTVRMGATKGEQVNVRVVAFPVPEEVANLRRMKTKKEIKGKNPSKELLFLLGWSIFITTLPKEDVTAKEIAQLYGIRWRIENVFKTWKSNFCFDHIHNVSALQLRMLLTARLTMISLLQHSIFNPLALVVKKVGRELSLMKFMRYAQNNFIEMMSHPSQAIRLENLLAPMLKYAVMDQRKRVSLGEQIQLLMQSISIQPLT